MVGNFLRNYLVILIVLFVTVWFLPNVSFGYQVGSAFSFQDFIEHLPVLLVAGLILTLLSSLARPVLELVTAPVNFLTLGLFNIVMNMGFFWVATYLVEGFYIMPLSIGQWHLNEFFSYSVVAIVFGFIQGLLALIF
jgi:putative membrane protein